jgi:bifunctional ADP-heptose synthase (sugar kinase/adenylyltransferase)
MNGAKHNDTIFPSPSPKQTIDVSGAGDTFTSFFSLKYYETKNISESITLADIEAGVKVYNATAVEPVNVADVAQCFGFGNIDNTQAVVWVQVDNRQ